MSEPVKHLARFATAADGTRIYYEAHGLAAGPGDAPPPAVLLVHGSGGHHAAWWQQVPALRGSYSVITLDLRGFGRSDVVTRPDGTPETANTAEDILAVLRDPALRATGIGPAVLVGQSVGAAAALRAAMLLDEAERAELVAGVVLAASLGGISHPDLAERVKADRAAADAIPVLDRLLTPAFREADPAKTFLFRQFGTFNVAGMADLRHLNTDGPTVEELAAAELPLCLLSGELDAVLSKPTIETAAALLPGVHVELVPGAPHSMYWEAPDLFNAALRRFLTKVFVEVPA
ncbi:MAG: alpha/beta hydrolase [Nocardioides sp.]|uniref:alpha/beta fold hydrolase n=1 Tax=Nocardioides sp. TaxID=35761 RepID=UPI0039E7141F